MRILRNVSAQELIKRLQSLGYETTRQRGSHIRLTTEQGGMHHITIPNHSPLRVGTVSGILSDVANHFDMTKSELVARLFEE